MTEVRAVHLTGHKSTLERKKQKRYKLNICVHVLDRNQKYKTSINDPKVLLTSGAAIQSLKKPQKQCFTDKAVSSAKVSIRAYKREESSSES